MKYLALIIGLIIVIPVFGQRKKKDDDVVTPAFVEGIAYSLPRTGLRIHVKAVKEKFVPGPYAIYAEQLLGIKDAKNKENVSWEIAEVSMGTFSEPDPAQVFKAMGEAAFLVSLTPEGCLAGVNCGEETQDSKIIISNSYIKKPQFKKRFSFDDFTDTPFYVPGDSTNNFRPVRVDPEQKAAEAATRILESRMSMYDMAAGLLDEFHPDGEAYKVSLKELKNIEQKYLSLFVGRTTYGSEKFSFEILPSATTGKGEVIFRFSDENGVVPASDLSGKPVMLKIEPVKILTDKYSEIVKSDNPNAGESGVFFRIPGVAEVNVIYELNTIATARTVLAQFGAIAPVPEELLYGEYSIKLHSETGAIKSVLKK